MATKHVTQFKTLVAEEFHDSLKFYRVIDGIIASAGDVLEAKLSKKKARLHAKFIQSSLSQSEFMLMQSLKVIPLKRGYL
jgi:cyclophilin family peptidyl-prolyl cis-trans isomerase